MGNRTSNKPAHEIHGTGRRLANFAGSEAELKAWFQAGALPTSLAGAIV
jgi:hypothetical protein